MAKKTNKNKPKNEPKQVVEKKTLFYRLKPIKFLIGFFNNEKNVRIFGFFFILILPLFLSVAFLSYFFTWQIDQNLFDKSYFDILFSLDINAENWLGKLGAIISHQFIYRWLGISSYGFILLSVLIGYKILVSKPKFSISKSFKHTVFYMLFVSAVLGYIFFNSNSDLLLFCGSFGYFINHWFYTIIGKFGTVLLYIFIVTVFVISNYKLKQLYVLFNNLFIKQESGNQSLGGRNDKGIHDGFDDIQDNNKKIDMETEQDEEGSKDVFFDDTIEQKASEDNVQELDPEIKNNDKTIDEDSEDDEQEAENSDDFEITINKDTEETSEKDIVIEIDPYDPTLDLSNYKYPTIDLLEAHGSGNNIDINKEELERNKNRIVETLKNYNIEIAKIKATIGPTVTLYEIIPAPGVRISKIKNLEDDIALSLAALGIRIIAPMPGKGTIGIEVPNSNPEVVSLKSVLSNEKFVNSKMALPVALGKTISNEVYVTDLAKMPHVLMAGATGQGKSVGLNVILASLLYKKHPSQIKFVLIDPKKVELTLFNQIEKHFLAKLPDTEDAIITDVTKVVNTLNSLCIEMDNRYDLLKDAKVRNIKEYNAKFLERRLNPEKGHNYMPYIVLIVDEFADLIVTAGREVETPIARLAQLARAVGIHLIIATQRPSVNVITGLIKANFPSRIAFRVTAKTDSRTILDTGGAEQLIGRGDMLYSSGSEIIRLQCAFIDTPEVEKLTEYIGEQQGYLEAFMLPEYEGENSEGNSEFSASDKDELFEEAARLIVQHQQGSTSLIQRKLQLGYNRAGRIIDQLEAAGVVGQFQGSKARDVLFADIESLEQFLKTL